MPRTIQADHRALSVALSGLPGADIVQRGMADLDAGELSVDALLLCIHSENLRRLGLPIAKPPTLDEPELRLYKLLCERNPDDAHAAYNAWVDRMDKFVRAASASMER